MFAIGSLIKGCCDSKILVILCDWREQQIFLQHTPSVLLVSQAYCLRMICKCPRVVRSMYCIKCSSHCFTVKWLFHTRFQSTFSFQGVKSFLTLFVWQIQGVLPLTIAAYNGIHILLWMWPFIPDSLTREIVCITRLLWFSVYSIHLSSMYISFSLYIFWYQIEMSSYLHKTNVSGITSWVKHFVAHFDWNAL